jgi:hypothetical protein
MTEPEYEPLPLPDDLPERREWFPRARARGDAADETRELDRRERPPSGPPPPPPPRHGGNGGGRDGDGDEPGVDTIMDDLLGAGPGPGYEDLGPGSAAVTAAIGGREAAAPVMAGAYWWTVTHSAQFRQAMNRAGVNARSAQQLLVAHAGGTRFDLLVFVPGWAAQPQVVPLRLSRTELTVAFDRAAVDPRRGITGRFRDLYPGVDRTRLSAAVREVGSNTEIGVVIAGTGTGIAEVSAEILTSTATGVPVPSVSVQVPAGSAGNWPAQAVPVHVATSGVQAAVGVMLRRRGKWVVTTALHAVRDRPDEIYIGGIRGTIVASSAMTDSCLIELAEDPPPGRLAGTGGAIVEALLPQYDKASFHRVGRPDSIQTKVLATDLSALERQSPDMTRVYTRPDTVPGDSGVALLDLQDRIAGFAYRRTAFGIENPFSTWVWADQVLLCLGVTK